MSKAVFCVPIDFLLHFIAALVFYCLSTFIVRREPFSFFLFFPNMRNFSSTVGVERNVYVCFRLKAVELLDVSHCAYSTSFFFAFLLNLAELQLQQRQIQCSSWLSVHQRMGSFYFSNMREA